MLLLLLIASFTLLLNSAGREKEGKGKQQQHSPTVQKLGLRPDCTDQQVSSELSAVQLSGAVTG